MIYLSAADRDVVLKLYVSMLKTLDHIHNTYIMCIIRILV